MVTIYKDDDRELYEYKITYERDMERPFVLNKLTPTYCLAYMEVNLIDIIFLDPVNFQTRAFELKLRDWKKVVFQAKYNADICNYSSIVMPFKFLEKKFKDLKEDVENTKIGVYGVKEGFLPRGVRPAVVEFKPMKKTKTEHLRNKVRKDSSWLRYYVPLYKKYSGGFVQSYKKLGWEY